MVRPKCTFGNAHSATSGRIWSEMRWRWYSTNKAKEKSNTYSWSLCDLGRPPAENSTHSAHANTAGHNGRQLTNREWEKHSEMSKNKRTENNRKLQLIIADSDRENRKWIQLWCHRKQEWVTVQLENWEQIVYKYTVFLLINCYLQNA